MLVKAASATWVLPDKVLRSAWPCATRPLSPHDYFAQVIPSQKELDRLEFLEQLFEAAIVEELRRLAAPPRREHQRAMVGYAVRIRRNRLHALFGVKESQQRRARAQHAMQAIHHHLQQWRR